MTTAIHQGNISQAINAWVNDEATATATYGHISTWDVSNCTSFYYLFYNKSTFNDDISGWDTSNVTTMGSCFQGCSAFNQDISKWNTSKVTTFEFMFYDAHAFNQNIGTKEVSVNGVTYTAWDTSSVTSTHRMFYTSSVNMAFNNGDSGDIGNWNTSAVTHMNLMFFKCTSFNQDITTKKVTVNGVTYTAWDMSNVTTIETMLRFCSVFTYDVRTWVISSGTNITLFSQGATLFNDLYGPVNSTSFFTGPPPEPTCFPAGTPIQTDQGVTAIEQLIPGEHTIRGKSIVAITQTRPLQKHIVCFEKDSIGKNVPSQQTLCSKEHKVLYQGEMIKARDLADMCKNVKKVSYNGETLYNVLLEKHGKMLVNNMICETLHPENIAAKIAKSKNSSMIRSMKR